MDEKTEKELRKSFREMSEDLTIDFNKIKETEIHIQSLLRQNHFSNMEIKILICMMEDNIIINLICTSSLLLSKFKDDFKI